MFSVDLVLNESCEYNCSYCLIKDKTNEVTLESLEKNDFLFTFLKTLHKKNLLSACVLQGGDISLLSIEVLTKVFDKLYPIIPIISCQRGFFKKNLHNIFKGKYSKLYYHISDLKKIPLIKEDAVIGIVDSDINKLVNTVKNNQHIYFDYVAFENELENDITINEIILKQQELNEKLSIFTNINIIDSLSYNELNNFRNNCNNSSYYTISLANNTIISCIRDYTNSVELTKDNLINLLKDKSPIFSTKCNSCTRSFIDKPQFSISTKIKTLLVLKGIL